MLLNFGSDLGVAGGSVGGPSGNFLATFWLLGPSWPPKPPRTPPRSFLGQILASILNDLGWIWEFHLVDLGMGWRSPCDGFAGPGVGWPAGQLDPPPLCLQGCRACQTPCQDLARAEGPPHTPRRPQATRFFQSTWCQFGANFPFGFFILHPKPIQEPSRSHPKSHLIFGIVF